MIGSKEHGHKTEPAPTEQLDEATLQVMKRMLNSPPKPHEQMKVGRPANSKKRGTKGPAVSAKRRNA
jgi:hypothetical protein